MIWSWFGHFFELGRERESTPYPPMILYAVLAETSAKDIRLQPMVLYAVLAETSARDSRLQY